MRSELRPGRTAGRWEAWGGGGASGAHVAHAAVDLAFPAGVLLLQRGDGGLRVPHVADDHAVTTRHEAVCIGVANAARAAGDDDALGTGLGPGLRLRAGLGSGSGSGLGAGPGGLSSGSAPLELTCGGRPLMSGPGMSMPAFSRMAPIGLPVAIATAERAVLASAAWPGRALPAKPWTTAAPSSIMIPSLIDTGT